LATAIKNLSQKIHIYIIKNCGLTYYDWNLGKRQLEQDCNNSWQWRALKSMHQPMIAEQVFLLTYGQWRLLSRGK
jgi:hypothetical protein